MKKNAKLWYKLLFLSVVINLLFCSYSSDTSYHEINWEKINQKADSLIITKVSNKGAGIAVFISENGKTMYERYEGLGNIHSGEEITKKSSFYLASLSKQFTAVAIMQLVERGELHLNDSLYRFFVNIPYSWKNITIHQCLTHQTGLYDYLNEKAINTKGATNKFVLDSLIKIEELQFTPGTTFRYCNTGYLYPLKDFLKRL